MKCYYCKAVGEFDKPGREGKAICSITGGAVQRHVNCTIDSIIKDIDDKYKRDMAKWSKMQKDRNKING